MREKVLDMMIDICEEEAIREEPDADLFELGLMDSLGMVELLVAMEDEFGISIAPTEITQEEVSSVNKIIALLRNKGLEVE